jgi:prepilin-type N-terminal cleavage/methylation domain-containing protein
MNASKSLKSRSGFTLVELMIVVGIVGLLATLAMPSMAKARDNSRLNVIYGNLRIIEQAKDQWALDNRYANGTAISDMSVLQGYFRYGAISPVVTEAYVPNEVGTNAQANLPANVALGPYGPGAAIVLP